MKSYTSIQQGESDKKMKYQSARAQHKDRMQIEEIFANGQQLTIATNHQTKYSLFHDEFPIFDWKIKRRKKK